MPITYDSLRETWPRESGREHFSMTSLVRRTEDAEMLDVHPDYQRGRSWTDEQCSRFIGFLAEGGEAPPLWVQRWPGVSAVRPDELVDGLQRVTAIARFLRGEIPMELTDGTRVLLADFSEADQRLVTRASGPHMEMRYIQCSTRADVLRFYLRLNRGGTPHSDIEIDRVRGLLAAEGGAP